MRFYENIDSQQPTDDTINVMYVIEVRERWEGAEQRGYSVSGGTFLPRTYRVGNFIPTLEEAIREADIFQRVVGGAWEREDSTDGRTVTYYRLAEE